MTNTSKHSIPFLFILLVLTGTFTGCKKYLDEDNRSNYTQENYFQTSDQAQAAINNLYASLRTITDGTGTYGESPYMMLEFPTGLANTEVGQSQYNNTLRTLSANADNNYFYVWWANSYNAIANANLAIERIPAINMDATLKKRMLGEAAFFRAFYYFHLVRIYGDVPLLLKSVNASSPELYPERAPQASVYDAIVSDLTTAEASGLPTADVSGKLNIGAVKSLLASVYLTMAGYPLQKTENYQKAADKANEVITSGAYRLFTTYADLRNKANKNLGEFIFQNQYQVGINTSGVDQAFLPRSRKITKFSDEVGAVTPAPEFYNSYEAGDLRAKEQQFYFSSYVSVLTGQTVSFGSQYIFKFFDTEAASTAQSDLNWTFIRYPEVLLIYAEASNELGGPTQAAYNAVNLIRTRAQLPNLSGLAQGTFREAIWREKYHELAYENKVWFDMVRTRKVYNPVSGQFDNFTGHAFPTGPVLTDKYLLFAIPSREINNNKKLTQNPGW
ncbi:Starch-binding associating with outer membrane [Pedobacter westerhofensis]|uniref:Starch-binding associating with outer membrane n=1 Tax=Pedobacter westerhofensis TaxID=425512 RepID=A0A521DCF4_9SPHI|nr:RagB/SusD family nutrient uptake outer membrane protein [Pedobacter westerhofensis]SMO69316.1 Starch-binding associating with outer membrane [Pedobacter westerhofensis]